MNTTIRRKAGKHRCAFTLVELLVVIGIISIMSGMFLIAYRGAQVEASNQRTRSTIAKITEVLNSRMQEYDNYPVSFVIPIPQNAIPVLPVGSASYESTTILLERARLLGLRDIIRLEMPDHPDDLKWTTSWRAALGSPLMADYNTLLRRSIPTGLGAGGPAFPISAMTPVPARAQRLLQRLSTVSGGVYVPIDGWENTNANAELLYLIVEESTVNGGQAIEIFGRSEIRDTDNDGLNEFVDAFGNPIRWIRWPSSLGSIAKYHPDLLDPSLPIETIASDPLDRMKADPGYGPFAVTSGGSLPSYSPQSLGFPLVISPGSDRKFGIRFQYAEPVATIAGKPSYSCGDVTWPAAKQPSWGPLTFTDPWHPRSLGTDGLPIGLGGLLINGFDPVTTVNATNTDVDLPVFSQDNISNYDGEGV